MRGYLCHYSYFYNSQLLQLTVNDVVLDPIYLEIEYLAMLDSEDSIITLHRNLNCLEISRLDLGDFTLSLNISIRHEKINAFNAVKFGSDIVVGLGGASGFKLIKISSESDHEMIDIESCGAVTAIQFFVKNSNIYVITGNNKGQVKLYRLKQSWEVAEELISCEDLVGNGDITNLLITGEKADREIVVAVGQGGKYPWQLAIILLSFPWNTYTLIKRVPGTRVELGSISAMESDRLGRYLFVAYDYVSKKRDLQIIQLGKNIKEIYKIELRSDSKIVGILPLGSSLNVQLMSDSGTEETIYNESLELEEERVLIPSFSDWFPTPKFPYHQHVVEKISQMRIQFGGQIFFDRLLEVIGVSAALYPPRNFGQWKILFNAIIEASDVDILRKHCLVYYLLKDSKSNTHETYAESFHLNPSFILLMNGLWSLDHGQAEDALICLLNPSVVPDWCPEIARALFACKKPELAMFFTHVSSADLSEESDLFNRMKTLIHKDLTLAFLFQRSIKDKIERIKLFYWMLDFCFKAEQNKSQVEILLELSLYDDEEQILKSYCFQSQSQMAENFLFMYYLKRSRFKEALCVHEKISFDKKREDLVSKLLKSIPTLEKEKDELAKVIEPDTTYQAELTLLKNARETGDFITHSKQKVEEKCDVAPESPEVVASKSFIEFSVQQPVERRDASKETFEIASTEEDTEVLVDSDILEPETENDQTELEDSHKSFLFSSENRTDSSGEYSDENSRSISPIPQQTISMDADSVDIADLSSFRHSEANITPLTYLNPESKELEVETPKPKITVTSGMKNISPFHQIIEPPKTVRKSALGTPPQPKRIGKVDSPILLRSSLRNSSRMKKLEKDEESSFRVTRIEDRKKKSNDSDTSLKLRGIRQAPSHDSSLLKSRKQKSPQERKLHTPTKNRAKLKGDRLESPAPISSSRFSLRKTPARLKYLGDASELNDESDSIPDYTPLRSASVNVNQLRGTKDIATPAVSILENARITRQRARKAIQQDQA